MGQIPNFCRACGEKLNDFERLFCARAACQDRARADALAAHTRLEGAPDTLGAMPKSRMLELLAADLEALGPKVHLGPRGVAVHAKLTLLVQDVKRHPWDDCAAFLGKREEILRPSSPFGPRIERQRNGTLGPTLDGSDGTKEWERRCALKDAELTARRALTDSDPAELCVERVDPALPCIAHWARDCKLCRTPENCPNHPPASTLRDVCCRDCGVDKRRGVLMDPDPIRLAHSNGRDIACKFGPVPVEPLSNATLQLMPQMPLRASRFIVNEDIASYFGLLYLRVGMDSVLGKMDESMMIPARAFTSDAIGIGFRLEACPGQLVSLVVRNCTHEHHVFSAVLLGTR